MAATRAGDSSDGTDSPQLGLTWLWRVHLPWCLWGPLCSGEPELAWTTRASTAAMAGTQHSWHQGDSLLHFLRGCCADGAPLPQDCATAPSINSVALPSTPQQLPDVFSTNTVGGGIPSSTSSTNKRVGSSTRGVTLGPEALVRWEDFMGWSWQISHPSATQPSSLLLLDRLGVGGVHMVGGTCGR